MPRWAAANTDAVQATRAVIDGARPMSVAAAQRGMSQRSDFRERIASISLPTLVLCGEYDSITTSQDMREMADRMPNSHFARISGAGHLAPLENPEETNHYLIKFLGA